MKNTNETINPYKISWAILTPKKGIARKEDVIKLNKFAMFNRSKNIMIHASSKDMLISKLNAVKGKLSKEYDVLIITDKQFGMTKNEDFKNVATSKQLKEGFVIR